MALHQDPIPNFSPSLGNTNTGGSQTPAQNQLSQTQTGFASRWKNIEDLYNQVQNGTISQKDFLSKTATEIPQYFNDINTYASHGQGPALDAKNYGLEKFNNEIFPAFNLYSSAQRVLGRELTPQEFAQYAPNFKGPNGMDTGPASLAQLSEQEKTNPALLGDKAKDYSGQINDLTQQLLKRGATPEEVDYFGRLLASGQTTPYQLQSFIQATPEYQTNQDTAFRGSLSNELQGYDQRAFDKARDSIMSGYARTGNLNSSGLDFAMTDALSKIAQNREQFLGGLSAQQYQGNKNLAIGNYSSNLDQLLNNMGYNRSLSDQTLAGLSSRANEGVDYQRQRDDLLNYLNSQPKQSSSPWDYLNAGLNVLNTGANVYRAFNPVKIG